MEQIKANRWQPAKIVNETKIDYGDVFSNYVNMFAELALRIFQQKSAEGIKEITINFYCALVDVNGRARIPVKAYSKALRIYVALAAVRLGLSRQSSGWKIANVKILSANRNRRLQICDVLSNASHGNYKKCGNETAKRLKESFGIYDYSLVINPLITKCEEQIQSSSWGLAIKTLAELNQLENKDARSRIFKDKRARLSDKRSSILLKMTR